MKIRYINGARELTKPTDKWAPAVSLVVPTYQVEKYLNEFFESLFTQTSNLQRFEIIIVNDGSTDDSGKIALTWAKKFPDQIRYIKQNNAGLSQARNTGLFAARGKWVGFPDPDDFVHHDYFRKMYEQTQINHENSLLAIVSHLLPYFEDTKQTRNNHPLNYRFANGTVYHDTSNLGQFMHLSAASAWFHRASILKHKLTFDPKVKPVFEDAHLINKLFMYEPNRTIAVVPNATYYYRKRLDQSSLVATSKLSPEFYYDSLKYGCLNLLEFAATRFEDIPYFVQRTCLYEATSRLRFLFSDFSRFSKLSEETQNKFWEIFERIISHIDSETIQAFELSLFSELERGFILSKFKETMEKDFSISVDRLDPVTRVARFSFYSTQQKEWEMSLNTDQRKYLPTSSKNSEIRITKGTSLFLNRYYFKLPKTKNFALVLNKQECEVRYFAKAINTPLDFVNFSKVLRPKPHEGSSNTARLRKDIINNTGYSKFEDSWILMDQPFLAGGDAEHLYRIIRSEQPEKPLWFVLSVLSPDWLRLLEDGFNLLPYGTDSHIAALAKCRFLVTSDIQTSSHWPVSFKKFMDISKMRTVLLPQEHYYKEFSGVNYSSGVSYLFLNDLDQAFFTEIDNDLTSWGAPDVCLTSFPRQQQLACGSGGTKTLLFVSSWTMDNANLDGSHPLKRKPYQVSDLEQRNEAWKTVYETNLLASLKNDMNWKIIVAGGSSVLKAYEFEDLHIPTIKISCGDSSELKQAFQNASVIITDLPELIYDAAKCKKQVLSLIEPIVGMEKPSEFIHDISRLNALAIKELILSFKIKKCDIDNCLNADTKIIQFLESLNTK